MKPGEVMAVANDVEKIIWATAFTRAYGSRDPAHADMLVVARLAARKAAEAVEAFRLLSPRELPERCEREEVQLLLDALPRCEYRGDCNEIAMRAHPGPVIGDYSRRCLAHPAEEENEFGERAAPLRWATAVAALASRGFRSRRA